MACLGPTMSQATILDGASPGKFAAPDSGLTALARRTSPAHSVQFYEDDDFLCDGVTAFLVGALRGRHPVVVIATELRREAIRQRLALEGIDVCAATRAGDIAMLDARETLAKLMVAGVPDRDRFLHVVGATIEKIVASRPDTLVHAYGEIVDVL